MRAGRSSAPICGLLCSVLLASLAFPGFSTLAARPELRLTQGVRLSLREKSLVQDELVERASADWGGEWGRCRWWVGPFLEARRNLEEGLWSRIEIGAELRGSPFHQWKAPFSWFQMASGLHRAWVKPGGDRIEWEIRALFDVPLPWRLGPRRSFLYALNEYTVDPASGEGIRNEIGAGLRVPISFSSSGLDLGLMLGWRHVDLIHGLDNDQFEGALQLRF